MAKLDEKRFYELYESYRKKKFGDVIYTKEDMQEETACVISCICRRRCKPQDIFLMVDVSEDEGDYEGIVFTSDSIIVLTGVSNTPMIVPYEDITGVDYGVENVYLNLEQKSVTVWCGEDADEYLYPLRLYSFIADILDELSDGKE